MEISLDLWIFTGNGMYDFALSQTGTSASVVWSSREGGNATQRVLTQ